MNLIVGFKNIRWAYYLGFKFDCYIQFLDQRNLLNKSYLTISDDLIDNPETIFSPMFQGFIFLFSVMNNKNKIETMTRKRQNVFIIGPNKSDLPLPAEYKK